MMKPTISAQTLTGETKNRIEEANKKVTALEIAKKITNKINREITSGKIGKILEIRRIIDFLCDYERYLPKCGEKYLDEALEKLKKVEDLVIERLVKRTDLSGYDDWDAWEIQEGLKQP